VEGRERRKPGQRDLDAVKSGKGPAILLHSHVGLISCVAAGPASRKKGSEHGNRRDDEEAFHAFYLVCPAQEMRLHANLSPECTESKVGLAPRRALPPPALLPPQIRRDRGGRGPASFPPPGGRYF